MPPAYSPSQKGAIAQFVGFTQTKDSIAAKVSQLCLHSEKQKYIWSLLRDNSRPTGGMLNKQLMLVGEQAASNILSLQLRRKPPIRNHQPEGLDRLWLDLEKRLARIPLDKNGSTLQDEDEVQLSQQLLAMDDAPFDYCLESFYEADEFPKWVSRRQSVQRRVKSLQTLFHKWITAFAPSDMEHLCKMPAMLRYALKRPLMPQRDLESTLEELGICVPPVYSRTMKPQPKKLHGREQRLLLGIDVDGSGPHHQSAQYDDLIFKGWLPLDQKIEVPEAPTTQDTGRSLDGVGDRKAHDKEELHRQLQATYTLFKKGTFDIGEAIDRYKDFLGARHISNIDLARRLEDFGIPKEHIMGPQIELDQAALHESLQRTYKYLHDGRLSLERAITWYRFLLNQPEEPLTDLANRLEELGLPREHIFGKVCEEDSPCSQGPAEGPELEVVEDVKNLVLAYRYGNFKLDEALSFVSARLEGLRIDQRRFSRLISSVDLTPSQAAQAIFESAAGESRSPSPTDQTDSDETKHLEWLANLFLEMYEEKIYDGLDSGIALTEFREELDVDDFQPHEVSFILAQLQDSDDCDQEVGGTTTTSDIGDAVDKDSRMLSSSMPPPEKRMSRERSPSLGSETLVRSGTPGDSSVATLCDDIAAQEPNLAVAEWEESFSGTAGYPEHCDYDLLRASPEHGFSTDLWGLNLPTAKAKKLALDIGLPTDYVNRRIRSLTPLRQNSTKARKMGSRATSPSIKRKASVTLPQGRQIRLIKFTDDPTVSAKEVGTYGAYVQGTCAAGASEGCATGQRSSDLDPIIDSIEEPGNKSQYHDAHAIDEYSETSGARGTADQSEMEMKRFTSLAIDGKQGPLENSSTILEYLESNVIEDGIFRVNFPIDSKSYKAAIRTIASKGLAEIANEIKWGSVRPIQSPRERQLITLLRDIERDPNSFDVRSLITSIQRGLREVAELADLGVLTNESSTKVGQGASTSPNPDVSSTSSDLEADSSSIFRGILATNPCPHKPSSRQTDLYKLYFGNPALIRDAGFVTQLFVCPECTKFNGYESLSLIEPFKKPRRLRLTQPKRRRRVVGDDNEVPFVGTPKDMSYSAAVDCQSFFVGLETRRRQRRNANLSATNDRYFQNPVSSPSSSGSTSQLNKLFEKYKDKSDPDADTIGIEGSMRYLGDLGVKLDEVVLLAVLTELSAPTMGELSRSGFVDGWRTRRATDINAQKATIRDLRRELPQPDFFRRVYKHTFKLALASGQKSLPLDIAIEYWRLLLQAPSINWYSPPTVTTPQASPWLEWWLDYLESRWKKGVSRDMWEQTGKLVLKTLEEGGETMGWWSEDGAWPGVIDQFVEYVREKRGEQEGRMEE
ncbi:MAG: hypothetical protein Q9195_003474 [Heterodermia aff. obscurata]